MPNMEAALTRRAPPVLVHPQQNKVSGARTAQSEVRSPASGVWNPKKLGWGDGVERKNYVPSRNVHENKQKKKVSRVRCEVSGCSSRFGGPRRRIGDGGERRNDVPSRNVHENKRGCPKSEVRSREAFVGGAPILSPGSLLLTPDSSRNEGASGDVVENTRSGTWDT